MIVLVAVLCLLAGATVGVLATLLWVPRIVARMSPLELTTFTARVAAARGQAPDPRITTST